MSERRAIISAWQSLSARPRSLMYSPLMHLVPVETQMTCASLTSVPVGVGGEQRHISQLMQPLKEHAVRVAQNGILHLERSDCDHLDGKLLV